MSLSVAQKLKIKEGNTLLSIHAPAGFKEKLGVLPASVKIITSGKAYQQVHWFATTKAQVDKEAKKILDLVKDGVICWIYFPKGSSTIQTDLSRDKGWDALLQHSATLTWLSLVSFDGTWSAFAFRLQTTAEKVKKPSTAERPILQYIDAATKTVRLPDDLALQLKKNKAANEFFNNLSYSNRKEYVEWIVTAKQEATRKTRLTAALEKLQNGWKNPRNA